MSLTPSDILVSLKARLAVNYVDDALFTDDDTLQLLSDAYIDACEESLCLRTLYTLTPVAGQAAYALPNVSQVLAVVSGGQRLEPLGLDSSFQDFAVNGTEVGFYVLNGTVGLIPTPTEATGPTLVLYAESPSAFSTYGDALDPRFPVEYADLLVHFVRWRVQMLAGGAERLGAAQGDRALYDARVKELRRSCEAITTEMTHQLLHAQDDRSWRAR